MFIFKKNLKLMAMLTEYLDVARETVREFQKAIEYMLEKGLDDHFVMLAEKTHQSESNADDIRRRIELFLYEKSLMPETRRDLLLMIENIDRVPNRAERIIYMYVTQKTIIYPGIENDLRELMKLSVETFDETINATLDCFGKMIRVKESNRIVDNNESLGDHLERRMITKIFESDLDMGEKMLQKEFVLEFGAICDLCESVLDRVVICSVKRHN
jgi:uncharacterized protein